MRPRLLAVAMGLAAALTVGGTARGQRGDENLANPTKLVTVERGGYAITALVTHLQDAKTFKYGIALFAGHPGILRLREEGGVPRFDLGGNFLVRSRRHWLDDETLVAVIDAPSDQWGSFYQHFRETPRYGEDVDALVAEIGRRYGIDDWTYAGTSEGVISAYHAARMHPARARRVILSASVFRAGRNGPGLSRVKFEELHSKLFWVHHVDDPCPFTAYSDAVDFARRSGQPLLTVKGGGPPRGEACQAQTAHGFVGVERETVLAMRGWVKSGAVPSDVVAGK